MFFLHIADTIKLMPITYISNASNCTSKEDIKVEK